MPREPLNYLASFEVPDHGVVLGSRDDAPPVGFTATEFTAALCPVSQRVGAPVSRSQTATVLSWDAETARRPSGLNATDHTQS